MATVTVNQGLSKIGYITEEYPATHYTVNSSTWYNIDSGRDDRGLIFAVNALSSSLKHNKLVTAKVVWHVRNTGNSKDVLSIQQSASDFNANTVTYNTAPTFSGLGNSGAELAGNTETDLSLPASPTSLPDELGGKLALSLLTAKTLKIHGSTYLNAIGAKTVLAGGGSPYVQIYYDNAVKSKSQVAYKSGAISGYLNPRYSSTFQWQYLKADSIICYSNTWAQSSATFYWKTSTASSYTAVSVSGSTTAVTIPANTFPTASTIQWYVSGTDEDGTTTQTPVYSFSTAAGTVSAVPITPKNSAEDGSSAITFKWDLTSTDGQPATRIYAAWKIYENTSDPWTPLFDVSSPITQYVVPANTFPAGNMVWTICGYNVDGTAGAFQEARFISVNAPRPVDGLSATSVPYSTISWQSSEQRAYQVLVDGVSVVKAFGESVYSYQLTEPLNDGDHEISVIVQGQYGYWSQPSTVTVTIQNQSGEDIILNAVEDVDVNLYWSGFDGDYYIYRDGKKIGHTSSNSFQDRLSAGMHSYYVINRLDGGYYTKSNIVEARTCFDGARIALLSGGNWFDITLTEKSATEQSFSYQRKFSSRHISGAVYPVLEMSSFEDFTGAYDCAFNDTKKALEFEQFRGQVVIIKSRGGKAVVGAMTSLSSHYGDFLAGYSFNIQRIHFEDYVDDTNG